MKKKRKKKKTCETHIVHIRRSSETGQFIGGGLGRCKGGKRRR